MAYRWGGPVLLSAVLSSLGCAESSGDHDAGVEDGRVEDAAFESDVAAETPGDVGADETAADPGVEDAGPDDAGPEDVGPPDRDGDTVPDDVDPFPDDPLEWADADRDFIGDNADPDDDNDGLSDDEESAYGTDCRISNPLNADTDDDGIPDPEDPYPADPWPEFVVNRNDVGSYYLYLSRRDGSFEDRVEGGDDIGDDYFGFTIADFDGDGRMDFIGHALTPAPDGTYDQYYFFRTARRDEFVQRLVGATNDPLGGTVADVDGDTLIDIVDWKMVRPPGEYITQVYADTYLNNGTIGTATCVYEDAPSTACAFRRVRAYDLTALLAGQWVFIQSYQAVDITGDGLKDIVFGHYASGGNEPVPVYVLQGVGDGTFISPRLLFTHNSSGSQSPANSIVFADFTSDGVGDVIVGLDDDGDPGQAWIYPGLGGGAFSSTGIVTFDVNLAVESGSDEPGATGSARCFDFDFDGRMDIMVGHSITMPTPPPGSSAFELWLGLGTGQFRSPAHVGPDLPNQYGHDFAIPTRLCPWYAP